MFVGTPLLLVLRWTTFIITMWITSMYSPGSSRIDDRVIYLHRGNATRSSVPVTFIPRARPNILKKMTRASVSTKIRAQFRPSTANMHPGDKVQVKWKDGKTYPAVITRPSNGKHCREGKVEVFFPLTNNCATVTAKNVTQESDIASTDRSDALEATLLHVRDIWKKDDQLDVLLRLAYHIGRGLEEAILAPVQSPAIVAAYNTGRANCDPLWLFKTLKTIAQGLTEPIGKPTGRALRNKPSDKSSDKSSDNSSSDDASSSVPRKKQKTTHKRRISSDSDALEDDSSEDDSSESIEPQSRYGNRGNDARVNGILSTPITSNAQLDRAREAYTCVVTDARVTANELEKLRRLYMQLLTPNLPTTDAIPKLLQRWNDEGKLVYSPDTHDPSRRYCFTGALKLFKDGQPGAELLLMKAVWYETDTMRGEIIPTIWGLTTSHDQTLTLCQIVRHQGDCQACHKLRCITVRLTTDPENASAQPWHIGANCAERIKIARDAHHFGHMVCTHRGDRASVITEVIVARWNEISMRIQKCKQMRND